MSRKDDVSVALPKEITPEDWSDDERMGFLMSGFKDRKVNPRSYDAKMKFWKSLIEDFCVHCKQLVFDEALLKKSFTRDDTLPACLKTVIESLQTEGKLVLLDEILKSGYNGQSWAAWSKEKLVSNPASFAVNKLWSALGYDSSSNASNSSQVEKFVCVPALKEFAEQLLDEKCPDHHVVGGSSPIMVLSDVLKEASNRQNTQIAIMWLCRNRLASVEDKISPALVKFGPNCQISEKDRQILELQRQEESLTRKLHLLEEEKETCVSEAKEYLKKGMKPAAKTSLRKKQVLEQKVTKLASSLTNLHMMLLQLKESETDTQVVEAYKKASKALKEVYNDTGLSEDNVASAIDDVEDALDLHQEVKNMISQPLGPSAFANDDEDFEKELEDLLADDEARPPDGGSTIGTDYKLPDVPSSPIGQTSVLSQLNSQSH